MHYAHVDQGRNISNAMEKLLKQRKNIVLAIIKNSECEILIAKRQVNVDQPDLWELPGGKIEENETPWDAVIREVKEEVDLTVLQLTQVLTFTHEYPEKIIDFTVFQITEYAGEAIGAENQEVRWVTVPEMENYQFPIANEQVTKIISK